MVLKITYGQSIASWLEFNILVAASGVAGTEGRTSYQGVLPVLGRCHLRSRQGAGVRLGTLRHPGQPDGPTTNPAGQTGLLCTNPN